MKDQNQFGSFWEHIPSGAEQWLRWAVVGIGLVIAVLAALLVGTGLHRLLFLFGVILAVPLVIVGMGRRTWILIPMGWYLSAYTGVLPIPLSVRDTMVILSTCAYVTYRITSGSAIRQGVKGLDTVLMCNLAYLMMTLLVNPVGFRVMGSETIGARIVFDIALASVAYWVIVRSPESPEAVARVPLYLLGGALFFSALYLSTYLFPSLPERLPYLYAALDIGSFSSSVENIGSELPRYKRLGDGGLVLVLVLCAYYPPRTLLNLLRVRFYLLLLGMVGILASGFRNVVMWAVAGLWISAWLHRQWREMVLVSVLGVLGLGMVVFGQGRFYNLPMPAQRSLSFLPGDWSPTVQSEAETSVQVRFQWWSDIINDHVIKNWWLGDGFGTKIEDMLAAQIQTSGVAGMTVSGSFHNGPLTTIRYCGIIGLIFFYALTIVCAVTAVRCVRRARGTQLQPLAILLAIELLYFPVHFTLVFGAYNVDMPQEIMLAGLLRLLVRMLDEQEAATGAPIGRPSAMPLHGTALSG